MRKETRELYKKAFEKWDQAQFIMAIEECSELIKALCKFWRNPVDPAGQNALNLIEEIADVQIMAETLEVVFDCSYRIRKIRRKKLRRLKKLLKPEEFLGVCSKIDKNF